MTSGVPVSKDKRKAGKHAHADTERQRVAFSITNWAQKEKLYRGEDNVSVAETLPNACEPCLQSLVFSSIPHFQGT